MSNCKNDDGIVRETPTDDELFEQYLKGYGDPFRFNLSGEELQGSIDRVKEYVAEGTFVGKLTAYEAPLAIPGGYKNATPNYIIAEA